MLKIRSFLRKMKDTLKNNGKKMFKRYSKNMAVTAYALSAVVLVFHFGDFSQLKFLNNEYLVNAASYEAEVKSEETNLSELSQSDNKEYALISTDNHIVIQTPKKNSAEYAETELSGMELKLFPLGQIFISPVTSQYDDMCVALGMIAAQDKSESHVEKNSKEEKDDVELFAEKKEEAKNNKSQNKKDAAKETASNSVVPGSLTLVNNQSMKKKLSSEELEVLHRIVEAEATGEDVYGKILVANVVINRMNSKEFPDTVTDVVFQKVGSAYQFSPTKDGRYWSVKISESTKEAVKRALDGEDYSNGALYFFARRLTTSKKARWFDTSLCKVAQYGCHEFYADK